MKKDIAVKHYPNPNRFQKFKMKLLSAFSWAWVKLDDETIINVRSVANKIFIPKSRIREYAERNTLKSEITQRVNDDLITRFKSHPVKDQALKDILIEPMQYHETTGSHEIFWDSENNQLIDSSNTDAADCRIPVNVYKEGEDLFIMIDIDKITPHGQRMTKSVIEGRVFMSTQNNPPLNDAKKASVAEGVYALARGED